jgi:probable F420-dependent oxidoreductase
MASIIPPGRLVYGIQLPIQTKSKTTAEEWELGCGRDEIATIARKADQTGFFYVGVCDHIAVPRPLDQHMRTTWYEPVATLGWLAGITTNVRLLSEVLVVPYRHPLLTAKAFMTLDEVSGGRTILGIGVGHARDEFRILGLDFARRGAVTDEALDLIRGAFAAEYPEFDGPTWSVHDAGLAPRPRQSSIPVWVGGSSKPALRRAARADGWIPQGTAREDMPAAVAYLREHRKRTHGDAPIDIGIGAAVYVGNPTWDVGAEPRQFRDGTGHVTTRFTLAGPPEQIAEHLREYRTFGVNYLMLRLRSRSLQELLDQMDAFHTGVAPLLN